MQCSQPSSRAASRAPSRAAGRAGSDFPDFSEIHSVFIALFAGQFLQEPFENSRETLRNPLQLKNAVSNSAGIPR
jgi:hypothetical protein